MAAKSDMKTNVMRVLDQKRLPISIIVMQIQAQSAARR